MKKFNNIVNTEIYGFINEDKFIKGGTVMSFYKFKNGNYEFAIKTKNMFGEVETYYVYSDDRLFIKKEDYFKYVIKHKKNLYGDNFPVASNYWQEYLNKDVTKRDVSKLMALLKQSKVDEILNKLNNNEFDLETKNKLNKALLDSVLDRDIYDWISENYDEYEEL